MKKTCSVVSCKRPAHAEWDSCAYKNIPVGLCKEHDLLVNSFFLAVVRPKSWEKELKKYAEKLGL